MELDYKNVYGVKTKVRVMDIREIAAEKIRAMNDRVRYRDFYDFFMIIKKLAVNFGEITNLVRQKEIRKIISKENILNNWQLAKQEKIGESQQIYYSEEAADKEIEKILEEINIGEIGIQSP